MSELVTGLTGTREKAGYRVPCTRLLRNSNASRPWDSLDTTRDGSKKCVIGEVSTKGHLLRARLFFFRMENGQELFFFLWPDPSGVVGENGGEPPMMAKEAMRQDYPS